MQELVHAIRNTGAHQPVMVESWRDDRLFEGASVLVGDSDVIYVASPRYSSVRTDSQRDAQFGFLAERAPVLASDWDLHLNDVSECSAIPSDPGAATEMVQANLVYFDAHGISWTVSAYSPGKLIQDFSLLDATVMDNGWTCGHASAEAGLGRVVQAYMRSTVTKGLFVVSAAGGMDVARNGFAVAYGPIMALRDAQSHQARLPLKLAGVSAQITDSAGVTRPAGIIWASAGWGQLNFVVPADSVPGQGILTIERADGSRATTNLMIADAAPAFWTGVSCRGPAEGTAIRVWGDGRKAASPISHCNAPSSKAVWADCSTVPIEVARRFTTRVRLEGSGLRNAKSAAQIEVTIGGRRVPVVSFGPAKAPGVDQLTIEVPVSMRGLGEADLLCHVNGRVSNAVRIAIGGGTSHM